MTLNSTATKTANDASNEALKQIISNDLAEMEEILPHTFYFHDIEDNTLKKVKVTHSKWADAMTTFKDLEDVKNQTVIKYISTL